MAIQDGFAIIVPVKEINDYIRESVPITLALDYENFEIIILPNELPSKPEPFLDHPKVKIIPTGRVSPATKRDMAARETDFRWLAFLDDDAYPAKDWLRVAERIFKTKKVQGIGGPGITPPGSGVLKQASGLFFETLIGGGGMDYRYKPGKRTDFFVDDYPTVNLIVDKEAFFDAGGFDNNYWPGEDTKFCLDFTNKGHKIMYSRDLVVWHHRRDVIGPHLKQVGNYGLHRGYFAKKFPKTSARLVYFVPSIFFLGNLFMLLDWMTFQSLTYLSAAGLGLYVLIAFFDVLSRTKKIPLILTTMLTVYLSHLYYGYMFLKGLCSTKHLQSQLR